MATLKLPSINEVRNWMFPTEKTAISVNSNGSFNATSGDDKNNLRNYVYPIQLQRLRQDIKSWREACEEMEIAILPFRVKVQRMFLDTILDGHIGACIQKRKDLSLLRQWSFKDKNGKENKQIKDMLNKPWFSLWLEYALEAKFFGYTLITLGDCVKNEFPDLGIIRRFNISPDRLQVAAIPWSPAGVNFMDGDVAKWHCWIPTPSDVGISRVGYGELYKVAKYEIYIRNLTGQNADATELYGAPFRAGKTTKQGEQRADFLQSLVQMGSSGSVVMDTDEDIELVESRGNGQGFKLFADFESRMEKKISKLLLGHADAIDSVPGKLGNSTKKSPAEIALTDKQTNDGIFLENAVNGILIPKLIEIGFNIDLGYRFTMDNNQEVVEQRMNDDNANLVTAQIALAMKNAGLQYDAKDFADRTGIKTTAVAIPVPVKPTLPPDVKAKLKLHFKAIEDCYKVNAR